jgi:hypothetical protein
LRPLRRRAKGGRDRRARSSLCLIRSAIVLGVLCPVNPTWPPLPRLAKERPLHRLGQLPVVVLPIHGLGLREGRHIAGEA